MSALLQRSQHEVQGHLGTPAVLGEIRRREREHPEGIVVATWRASVVVDSRAEPQRGQLNRADQPNCSTTVSERAECLY